MKEPKVAICKCCQEPFTKVRPLQRACSPSCALWIAKEKREKVERKETKEKLVNLKTRKDWIKDAQVAFNKFIRCRDALKPCICCGEPLGKSSVGGYYDAGHFRSVGSAGHLRFNEDNVAAQRKQCNKWGAGRHADFRLGLIERIGLEAVERIESDHQYHQWTIDELKAIVKEYRLKAKALAQ